MKRRMPLEALRSAPVRIRPAEEFWADFRTRVPERPRVEPAVMWRSLPVAAGVAVALAVAAVVTLPWFGASARAAGVRLDSIEIGVPHGGVVVMYDEATSGMIVAIDGLAETETAR